MAVEENRRIAEEFFRCIDRNDVEGALALPADGQPTDRRREYLDTQHVYEVWFKPETAKA